MPPAVLGAEARRQSDHASASDWLSALPPRVAEPRFAAAAAAQLPRRRARRSVAIWRIRTRGVGALLDVAGARNEGRDTRGSPLTAPPGAGISQTDRRNPKAALDAW